MNLKNIFNEIEKVDPEIYERLDSRRHAMHRFTNMGKKLALTAIPVALGGMLTKAYAGPPPTTIVDILNFALTLEYLEAGFYTTAVGTSGLIDAAEVASFTTIRDHENEHVAFLTSTITSLNGTPTPKPTFDFTAGGTFPTVFSDYQTFLAVSQTFEDTGVRAYKGQAGGLISSNDVLTAALQIHSVEARHASHVRKVRGQKGWITGKDTGGIGASVQPSYDGEENVIQLGVDITTLTGADGSSKISINAATQAFDEALDYDSVIAIVTPFITG